MLRKPAAAPRAHDCDIDEAAAVSQPFVLHEGFPEGAVTTIVERDAATCPFTEVERQASIGSV